MLKITDLEKSYPEGAGRRYVLKGVNLEVAAGQVVALLGKSGSGKSTLLNLICGIDRPDAGRIEIDGCEISSFDDNEATLFRRARIGFVFQFFNLVPTLTVAENVLLPLELNGLSERAAEVDSWLEKVGLADRRDTYPENLSGGEQQRVALARAVVHCPPLILADEPTGNLDEETGKQVLELLNALPRETGQTVLMVTHSREAAAIADHRFALRRGELESLNE